MQNHLWSHLYWKYVRFQPCSFMENVFDTTNIFRWFSSYSLWTNYNNCLSSFIHPWSNSFVLIRISILSHLSIMWQSCDNVVPIYLTPMSASSLVSSAIPPGLSDTVTTNRMSRPSAAKPRSMTRPRAVVSMLPPQSATTTLIKNGNG